MARFAKSFVIFGAGLASAAPAYGQLSAGVSFAPADPARSHMDIAGAWDGSADVTAVGDRFVVTLTNSSAEDPLYDLTVDVEVPTGFSERTAALNLTLDDPSCGATPIAIVSRVGDVLSFDFNEYDLPPGCALSFDFGLVAPSGTAAGTYGVTMTAAFAESDGGVQDQTVVSARSFPVLAGAVIFDKTPGVATQQVGDTIIWRLTATNSGLGGLFDVTLDESGLGSGFSGLALSPVGVPPAGTFVDGQTVIVPYLAPNESVGVDVSAEVAACLGLTNQAAFSERTGDVSATADASVALTLLQPDVDYTLSSTPVPLGGTGTITIDLTNSGAGEARSLEIQTNLPSAPIQIDAVSSGWTYSAATGTITQDGGVLAGNASTSVVLTVSDAGDQCSVASGATFAATATYTDQCATVFTTPASLGSISLAPVPSISVAVTGPNRLARNQSGVITLTAGAGDAGNLSSDPVEVSYPLPDGIQANSAISASAGTPTCSGSCGPGDVVEWLIPRSALISGAPTLSITIQAQDEACASGVGYASTATINGDFASGVCPLSDADGFTFLLSNMSSGTITQNFNASGEPFETGAPDNGDGIRQEGEGEEAEFEANYAFPAADSGIWTGTTFEDDFGGLQDVQLTLSSLEYRLNAGAWVTIDPANVTGGTGGFEVDLSFLAAPAIDSTPGVEGDTLDIRYTLTAPDIVLSGDVSRTVNQFTTLTLASGSQSEDACALNGDIEFRQGDRVTWQRAAGNISLTLSDNIIDVCEVVDARLSVSNDADGLPIRNLIASLDLGSAFELVVPSTPTYTGGLDPSSVSVTYNDGAPGGPTLTLNEETLASGGSISVPVRRLATASGPGGAVSGRIDYDSNDTAPDPGRAFAATSSAAPQLVRSAELSLFVTPSQLPVIGSTAEWTITLTNTGSGVAYGAELNDDIPAGLTVTPANILAMNQVNGPLTVSEANGTISWGVGDLAPGQSVQVRAIADVDGTSCEPPASPNLVTGQWGCGGTVAQAQVSARPDLSFPPGNIQIFHDTSGANASLCGQGQVVVVVRNAGASEVKNASVTEVLNTAATGISLSGSTVEYSADGGATWTVASVTPASTLTFDGGNIPPLALLAPFGTAGSEVLIRFAIDTDDRTNFNSGLAASGSAQLHCGDNVSSPASTFSVPVQRPRLDVSKTGRNVTLGLADGETVYARPNDQIEWTVEVQNTGTLATTQLRLRDLLAGSGGAASISGHGASGPVTSDYVTIDPLGPNETATLTITETLGATCVTASNVADVTWGCAATPLGAALALSSPGDREDGALLIMRPVAADIDLSVEMVNSEGVGAPDLNGLARIRLTNSSAPFTEGAITLTLPDGYIYDAFGAPTFQTTDTQPDAETGVSINAADPAAPILTLTGGGWVHNGAELEILLPVIAATLNDTASDAAVREETVANSNDPAPLANGTISARLDFESGCGEAGSTSDSNAVAPNTPDLDLDILDPISRLVAGQGETLTYTLSARNRGTATADDAALEIVTGGGWTGTPPPGCTGAVPGTLTCDLSGPSLALAPGAARTFDLDLEVDNETSPLTVSATVTGQIVDAAGDDTGRLYSLDAIAAQTLGYRQSLDLLATSEADFAAPADLQIGEDATLRLTTVWFGGGAQTVTAPKIDLGFEANSRFAFISDRVEAGPAYTSSALSSGNAAGPQSYTLADFTGGVTSVIDVTVRALDASGNTPGASFAFTADGSSTFLGQDFGPGSPGYPALAAREETLQTERPALELVKEVRREDPVGTFADTSTGDAGDAFRYQVTVTNSGTAPAFDLSVTDTLETGLAPQDLGADNIDNDGDGAEDEPAEGGLSGQVLTFDADNTSSGPLARLDPGASVTLTYLAIAEPSVNPDQAIANAAAVAADTLQGASGNQTAPVGANGAPLGAGELAADDAVTVTIESVALAKDLVLTSVNGDNDPSVLIGEQAEFELDIVLPAGTVDGFVVRDTLPANLALVSRQPPSLGNALSCGQALETTASPPSGDGVVAGWDFGTCTVADESATDRTLTLKYTTQVENGAAIARGVTLPNLAEYEHSRTGGPVQIAPVSLTVTEPGLALTLAVTPPNNVDAGDLITLSYTVENTGDAPAFEVDLTTLFNDNNASAGPDGDVNFAAAFGNALRDVNIVACTQTPTDTSSGPGSTDFSFDFAASDGDGDATPEDGDCAATYSNVVSTGLAPGSSVTLTTQVEAAESLVLQSTYTLGAALTATSLPPLAPGADDPAYERSADNDPSPNGRFSSAATDTLAARNVPTPNKTFIASDDANTAMPTATAIDVAIGETYTARIAYNFDEGTTRDVRVRELSRIAGENVPADIEFIAARLMRTSAQLEAAGGGTGINSTPANTFIDVTPQITETASSVWSIFELALGDVTNSGAGNPGRETESYVLEYDFRVRNVDSNSGGRVLQDRGQTRLLNAENASRNRNGNLAAATIEEPSFSVTKTTSDADGLLSPGETVEFTVTALNSGAGPAYSLVLQDELPPALRGGGVTVTAVRIDGAPATQAPSFTYDPATGLAQWAFPEGTVIAPGGEIEIVYTATADPGLAPGTSQTNVFNVAAFFSQPASQPNDRRQSPQSPSASVTLGIPALAFTPDQGETVQPGTTVIYPHLLKVPVGLPGATLSFAQASSKGLGWTIWYDADGSGDLSGADTRWVNGGLLPSGDTLTFFAQAQIPADAANGYRDVTELTATVAAGAFSFSGRVTDVTLVSRLDAGEIQSTKAMAIDSDCDGALTDETPGDAAFDAFKAAEPGECIIYRVTYRNTGTGAVSDVTVQDQVPAYTVYLGGSATYAATPATLTPGPLEAPADGARGAVSFAYDGALPSGETGAVEFGVRVAE
ncbi:MAG: hypothetical protein AAGH87_03985 [Pseudomonadota bacterium]